MRRLFSWVFLLSVSNFPCVAAFAGSAPNALYVGFNAPGDSAIDVYPLTANAIGHGFAAATDPQSLTIAGGKLYWIDGGQILDSNLDGTGLSVLQTFLDVPTSIAVDFSGERLFAGFNTPIGHDIGVYPLTPDATGKPFAAAADPQSLTVAGENSTGSTAGRYSTRTSTARTFPSCKPSWTSRPPSGSTFPANGFSLASTLRLAMTSASIR